MLCSNGHQGADVDQDNLRISGMLEDKMIDDITHEIEDCDLEKGDIVYYYFDKADEEIIRGSMDAAGKARSLCRNCIFDTIEKTFTKKDPHYGDGVYLSMNYNLNKANDFVKACHGDYVAGRLLRVKFRIDAPEKIIKVKRTGGVLKTNEGRTYYEKGNLIFLNKDRDQNIATYLGIEEYKNNSWSIR